MQSTIINQAHFQVCSLSAIHPLNFTNRQPLLRTFYWTVSTKAVSFCEFERWSSLKIARETFRGGNARCVSISRFDTFDKSINCSAIVHSITFSTRILERRNLTWNRLEGSAAKLCPLALDNIWPNESTVIFKSRLQYKGFFFR